MFQKTRGDLRKSAPAGALLFLAGLFVFAGILQATAQTESFGDLDLKSPSQVEITGDKVDVSIPDNKVIVTGHVTVRRQDVTLTCDYLEFSRATQIAVAQGHVTLKRSESQMEGDRLKFDFGAMKGDFLDAEFSGRPFKGAGRTISKVGEKQLHVEQGYLTTCDLDAPHYRFSAKKADIYVQDKAVMRNVTFKLGTMPLFYMPKFTQSLRDRSSAFIVTPGYMKQWGAFLLTQYRYHITRNVRLILHADYRSRRDFASGFDVNYDTESIGSGILRTYYMNERNRGKNHVWQKYNEPTVERERFKIEYRHKWEIDPQTMLLGQYYKLSDADFLDRYAPRESDQDVSPSTYFLVTRNLMSSTVSLRADVRVNRFTTVVERQPEINYTLPDVKIGESGFYFRNTTTFSNLDQENASPSNVRPQTVRLDTENILSYPFKVSFIELRPFVGGRQTYYSKAVNSGDDNSVRTAFETGSDVSTKFFRIFDVETNAWGLDISRLRHVVTPSVAYFYTHEPSIPSSYFTQFDSVDAFSQAHGMTLSLENKLQTKRKGLSTDLLRFVLGSDFRLKGDAAKGGFNNVTAQMDVKPYPWAALYLDSLYDSITEELQTLNTDLYFQDDKNGRWYFRFGRRYAVGGSEELTMDTGFTINPKWKFLVYQRFDIDGGRSLEQQYTLRRDMHCWMMEFMSAKRQDGSNEIWVVFTLKDFPDLGFNISTGFNQRRPGAQ